MEFALEFFTNLIYVSIFIVIGTLFMGFERRNCKFEKSALLSITLVATGLWFVLDVWLRALVHVLCIVIILCLFFDVKKRILGVFYLGVTASFTMISLIFEMVVREVVSYIQIDVDANILLFISYFVAMLFIWGVGVYFNVKYVEYLKMVEKKYYLILVSILLLDSTIVGLLGDFILYDLDTSKKIVPILLYIGIVVGILVQIVLLINTLITRNIYKENVALAQKYLDNQNEHYLYLEKREVETKKFRHDIKNHLLLLGNLMQNADYDGANQYLDTINDKVSAFGNRISVNNSIADAILNKYLDEADQKGIEIKVAGHFPLACFISAYDICTVLSNLLSNAILAEEQAQGKRVELEIRYTEDEILFLMENDYVYELKMENGTFQSTKKEEAGHGYGLVNVKECVEKNDGTFLIDTENQKFKVMLSMKNRQGEIS